MDSIYLSLLWHLYFFRHAIDTCCILTTVNTSHCLTLGHTSVRCFLFIFFFFYSKNFLLACRITHCRMVTICYFYVLCFAFSFTIGFSFFSFFFLLYLSMRVFILALLLNTFTSACNQSTIIYFVLSFLFYSLRCSKSIGFSCICASSQSSCFFINRFFIYNSLHNI